MNLRHIVPALGLMALTSAPALAADGPAVSFNGWVDTILSYSSDDIEDDDTNTDKDEEADTLRFTGQASLKAKWQVTEALTAHVNLWFNAGDSFNGTDDGATVSGSTNVNLRDAYFAWKINDTITWSMGKYINTIGWIAAEPTGLYTVNNSHIGYLDVYGNDVIGTSIGFAPKDSPFSGSFHVTNGYFTAIDGTNDGPSVNRENSDLGFGLDLTYAFGDKGNINVDFAYDMASDVNAADDTDLGGDVLLIGANATIKPTKPLTLGAEVMFLTVDESEQDEAAIDLLQFMVMGNYAIEGASIPMSVTGMVQYVQIEVDVANAETEKRLGITGALLTNPLSSSNFGLNFEIGYWDVADDVAGNIALGGTEPDATGFVVSVEGLVSF